MNEEEKTKLDNFIQNNLWGNICSDCGGGGGSPETCSTCGGSGIVEWQLELLIKYIDEHFVLKSEVLEVVHKTIKILEKAKQ